MKNLTGTQLVTRYNAAAKILDENLVLKFSTKAVGIKRITDIEARLPKPKADKPVKLKDDNRWLSNLNELKFWYDKGVGHPRRGKHVENQAEHLLGHLVGSLRLKKRQGKLPQSRIDQLNTIKAWDWGKA